MLWFHHVFRLRVGCHGGSAGDMALVLDLGVQGKGSSSELLPLHLCPRIHQEGLVVVDPVQRPLPARHPREADLALGSVRECQEPVE